MDKFVFTIPTYRAIQEATIVNEGITVIAGENGSGKSTISRLIYYTVNIINQFHKYIFKETKDKVSRIGRKLDTIISQTSRSRQERNVISDASWKFEYSTNFEELEENFEKLLKECSYMLDHYFSKETDTRKISRILNYIGVDDDYSRSSDLATICIDFLRDSFAKSIEKAKNNIDKKPRALLMDYILHYGADLQDLPNKGLKLSENDVDLITSKFFSQPFNLNRAIYIDTPMALNNYISIGNDYWNKLPDLMRTPLGSIDLKEKKLLLELKKIISGDIVTEEDPKGFLYKNLCYKREDGLEIDLINAATGFKSFAYLLKLLANGYLKKETLLIIDEPEAHLHPQWIVEFANILVKLNKKIGVKIMVTSHNPDMVSAIRAISETEGILDTTRFYLAERSVKNNYKYEYKDLGNNIAPIFESFNIALSRIELYGAGSSI